LGRVREASPKHALAHMMKNITKNLSFIN